MRLLCPLVLLAAVTRGEVFQFDGQLGHSSAHGVRDDTISQDKYTQTNRNIRFSPARMPFHIKQMENVLKDDPNGNDTYSNLCSIDQKEMRTYNNVTTFKLDVIPHCNYIFTQDKLHNPPEFITAFKVLDAESFLKKILVKFYSTVIEIEPFLPENSHFPVTVNETTYDVRFGSGLVVDFAINNSVYVNAFHAPEVRYGPVIQVLTESEDIFIEFDGMSIQTFVADSFSGKVNGLCGTDEDGPTKKFIGPDGKEYSNSKEFIASYGMGKECQVPVKGRKEERMENVHEEVQKIRHHMQHEWNRMHHQIEPESRLLSQPQYSREQKDS